MADNRFTQRELKRSQQRFLSEHLGNNVNQLIEQLSKRSHMFDGSAYSYDENLLPLLEQKAAAEDTQEDNSDIRIAHEHWIVSEWLGHHLTNKGEMVGSLFGLTIWGRTTTGLAIYLDDVIEEIHNEHRVKTQRGSNAR
ncbi:hypothetical protein AAFN60_19015 [Roseibacillus persicicus]|uniref:hypothetical protein n=1 Tax=Roseibacillus persicicus TaxID=454148 RepID=UPI00398B18D8